MDIYYSIEDIPNYHGSVITMGTFDGLHRGHQEIIKKVSTIAHSQNTQAVLITFDPHPRHILERGEKLPLLLHIDRKLELLESLGLDVVVVIPFNDEFSRMEANNFLNIVIVEKFDPVRVVVGYNHHFGYGREGSPDYLKDYGRTHGFKVDIVAPVRDEEIIISSTHIRGLIKSGFVRRASFELGWVFGFKATVVHGSGRGRSLKFPTANFIPVEKNQLIPARGVYFTRGRINGKNLYGMCNLGVRPTFNESDFVMEVHFFEQDLDDLYTEIITVEFLERIRNEKKFSTPVELTEQLKQDEKFCLKLLKKYNLGGFNATN